ncbi:MAG: cadherin-like domain-containing protein, partial [Zoogloea sp.]|nr:cadherin-like domain-containing protein [Zoogloea sp.]
GPGNATITVSTTDEDGSFTLGTQAVTIDNVAPTASVSGAATVAEGSLYTLSVGPITDPGADTRSGYTIAWGDGSTDSFTAAEWTAAAGSFTHTYADGPGNATITVSTTDEDGATVLGTQAVTIDNVAPTVAASGAANATVGVAYTLALANYLDPGQDSLLPDGITINWGDGSTSTASGVGDLTHTYTAAGSPTITVSLADEDGTYANVASLALSVAPAGGGNTAPVADDETYTLRPGQTLDIPAPGVLDGDTDADGDALFVQSVDTTGLRGALTQFADGSLRFTPEAGFSGTTGYTYTVSDGMGGRDTATVTLNVVNTAPVADDETYTLRPGQTLDIPAPGVLDGDTDADGDTLTVLSVDTTGLVGTLTQFLDGSLRFTADAGFTGTTGYTYTVSDGMGGTDTATVTFNVMNTAPVARDDRYSVHAGLPLVVMPGVLGNDADADLDALFVSSYDASGLDGSLVLLADGSFSFTPTAGFAGSTAFTYTVADGYGGSASAEVVIDVTNTAPVADDEVLHVWRNGSLTLPAPGVLTGDSDADGDALVVSGVDTTGLAGSLSWNPDGSLSFTPTAGFTGSTGFRYQVADGNGGFDTGNVRIEVLPEVTTTTRIGDAPLRESGLGGQWTAAWAHTGISAVHKHDATSAAEAWTPVAYHAIGTTLLSGGDVYAGDLGVSSQSVATSSVRQEIDGSEALRFELASEATGVTVNLSRFFINDDGSLFAESGRLRLLDDSGAVVSETTFQATNAAGTHEVSLGWQDGFSAVELSAGAWDGTDFVFGAYDGGAPIATDGAGKP